MPEKSRPTPRPIRGTKKRSAPAGKLGFPTGALFCLGGGVLSHLRHEVAHGLGCLVLLLPRGVGVGPQGESGVVVAQHGGHRLDVHAILESQGGEGAPEIVEPEVLQASVLEDALVQRDHGVRVVHGSGAGGGEEPGVAWVLGVLSHQQLHCLLWDGDQPDGVLCLEAGHDEVVVLVFGGLLADGDGFAWDVQVLPPQGHQFAFPNPADQLQIEHGQGIPPHPGRL